MNADFFTIAIQNPHMSRTPELFVAFFTHLQETDLNQHAQIYYHSLGSPQSQDQVIFSIPDHPTHMPGATVSDDGQYLVLTISESCDPANKVYISSLKDFDGSSASLDFTRVVEYGFFFVFWKFTLFSTFEAEFRYLTNDGPLFWFQSTLDAPNKRIVQYDLRNPEKGFVTLVPESTSVLDDVTVIDKDKLVLVYLQDVKVCFFKTLTHTARYEIALALYRRSDRARRASAASRIHHPEHVWKTRALGTLLLLFLFYLSRNDLPL